MPLSLARRVHGVIDHAIDGVIDHAIDYVTFSWASEKIKLLRRVLDLSIVALEYQFLLRSIVTTRFF